MRYIIDNSDIKIIVVLTLIGGFVTLIQSFISIQNFGVALGTVIGMILGMSGVVLYIITIKKENIIDKVKCKDVLVEQEIKVI